MSRPIILVTGGAGYIGSHTVVQLIEHGFAPVIFDNFSNSSPESIRRVEQITRQTIPVVEGDIRSLEDLHQVFEAYPIESVIHFAGLKAVGESVVQPLRYYDNNVYGALRLLEAMKEYGCRQIVFSSSATVYGDPATVPILEDFSLSATNPYGRSKLMIEEILRDLYVSDTTWKIILLRYFNPVGAHPSGLIGEDPDGIPNNLMPYITQTAVGQLSCLSVFGNDYDTPDGTGVRDYIHVVDLAEGHIKALDKINQIDEVLAVNLGTGKGYSVIEMVKAFEKASGREVPFCFAPRRPGDIAACYADPTLAREVLDWEAKYGIEKMCEDAWRWQIENSKKF